MNSENNKSFEFVDLGNVGHTCSEDTDTEDSPETAFRRFQRKLNKRKLQSDSDSDMEIKKQRVDANLPKYYEFATMQNQEGMPGFRPLWDESSVESVKSEENT